MQGFNHVAGGIVFTGIFASFTDVNIFESPEYFGATVLFSVLPDADHTRSLIGKSVYPLARFINTKFGHRTITHSFIFILSVVVVIRISEMMLYKPPIFSIIAFYGILSHCIFDMCTRQGIQFFYPFSKRPAVLPANPQMRLQTNDLRSEAIIFVIFCSLIAFCQPLFANGFWTQYYKTFLTYKAVRQEANRSKELIEIKFIEKGADTTKAIFIAHEETYFVIYDFKNFKRIDVNPATKFIDFKKTNYLLEIEQKQILNVEPDSLKSFLKLPILKAQIQSSQELKYYDGAVTKAGKDLNFEYKQGFNFTFDDISFADKLTEIELLKVQKQEEIQSYQSKLRQKYSEVSKVREKEESLFTERRNLAKIIKNGSAYEKGKAIDRMKETDRELENLEFESVEIEPLNQKDIDLKIKAIEDEIKATKVVLSANLAIMKLVNSKENVFKSVSNDGW